MGIFNSFSLLGMLFLLVFQCFFQLENLHFHADNIVVLVDNDFFYSSHIDVWFFRVVGRARVVSEVPGLDLPFHASIFLFHIPDTGLVRTVFLLDLVNETFEVIVFVPNYILGGHVAVEVDVGLEDVMVQIYLFAEVFFVTDATVKLLLSGFE